MIKIVKPIFYIVVCQLAGVIGSIFTVPAINNWYLYLNKPVFNPPNWIFGPVWTILYTLMGISLYLILESKRQKQVALIIFSVQLILNTLWSLIFFGLHNLFGGLIIIIAMCMAILATMIQFNKISKLAGKMLIPYLLWVSFATVLNFSVYILNP